MSLDCHQSQVKSALRRAPLRYIDDEGFSEWLSSDDDISIVRRCDKITARVTLLLQWEEMQLGKEVLDKDLESNRRVVKELHNGSFALDDGERQQTIKKVQSKLKKYCET